MGSRLRGTWVSVAGCVLLGFSLAMAGCGGGGGGDDSGGTAPPPTIPPSAPPASAPPASAPEHTLVSIRTDTLPAGARIDVAARKLTPLHPGDHATFARSVNGAASGTAVRQAASAPDAAGYLAVTETVGAASTTQKFKADSDGLLLADPLRAEGSHPGAYDALPSILLYPSPFYPVGSTRLHVRQGALGADVDGDGRSDYFSATVLQRFVGFESVTVFGAATGVAHFQTEISFMTQSVATGLQKTTIRTEDVWLADEIGPVRIQRSGTDNGIALPVVRLDLQSATIDGVDYPSVAVGPKVVIALQHEFLVYDSVRKVYYASMSSSSSQPGRIATIQATSGAVSYSAIVGSAPKALALSSDGASLWVALDGSADVVRLTLPAMSEASRVHLPLSGFFGQIYAEELAASPIAPNAVAVAMYVKGFSPRFAGVGLIRADALQPIVQTFSGTNSIGFGADGVSLFGYINETTEFALTRMTVAANGVTYRDQVSTDDRFYSRLRVADGLAVVNSKVFRTSDLSFVGAVAGARDCVKLSGVSKLVCHSDDIFDPTTLVIADSTTLVASGTAAYATTAPDVSYGRWRLVPGPAGAIAVSEPDRVVLYGDALLR